MPVCGRRQEARRAAGAGKGRAARIDDNPTMDLRREAGILSRFYAARKPGSVRAWPHPREAAEGMLFFENADERVTTRKILDFSISWKTLTSQYYEFLSKVVGDPIMKQRFRLMASEERDHRKILRKYRRELCGKGETLMTEDEVRGQRARFTFLEVNDRPTLQVAVDCVLAAESESNRFFTVASGKIENREGRIFLRLLAEEGLIHRSMVDELMEYANSRDIRFSKNSAAIAQAARR
jgi:rubrerythrin